jgi:hypothetical protein
MHAREMHTREIYAHEMCAYEMHELGRCGEIFDLSLSVPISSIYR